MTLLQTEAVPAECAGIDTVPDAAVLAQLLAGQKAAVLAVGSAQVQIAAAAGMMAVLMAAGVDGLEQARAMLKAAQGNLRTALTALGFYE